MLVLVFVFSGVLFALVAVAAVAGLYGAMFGERIDRCPGCGHYGVTSGGFIHPLGCPDQPVLRVERRISAFLHHPHLVHH